MDGSDANPGTAAQPFQTVGYALTTAIVSSAANTIGSGTDGGTDVTVTVVSAATETVSGDIATPSLTRGSVTVVGPSGFNLNLSNKLLTLNKGYRLKGFKITSGDPSRSGRAAAITLAGVGTSLNTMQIDCEGLNTAGASFRTLGDKCIAVTALTLDGTILLKGLEVKIKGDKDFTAAIVHAGNNTTLEVVSSTIESTGNGGQGVVGVLGQASAGPVIVQSSTVDLDTITTGNNSSPSIAVWLQKGGSKVLGPSSQIKLNGTPGTGNDEGAIGVEVSHSSGQVVVDGTAFSTLTNNVGVGIRKAGTGTLILGTNTFPTSPPLLKKNTDP